MSTRSSYTGHERKLVLAFDVGTTYSGISYTILDPGIEPVIFPVTRFPDCVAVGGSAKVPTVIYYAEDGKPQAIGGKTEEEGLDLRAEERGWVKAEWFKLHLRPRTRANQSVSDDIPPLPPGKIAVDIFADFLKYLKQCAKTYIEEAHPSDGVNLWRSGNEEYILSHPNAWEGAQQTMMRTAAVQAGLVPDVSASYQRISFISEGEASLNFCLDKQLINDSIGHGDGVIIADVGGGTLDVSAYAKKSSLQDEYEEIAATQSYFKGSIFVTRAAELYLDDFLRGTRFHDDVPYMVRRFDKYTKIAFHTADDPQHIKFGGARDRDPSLGIRSGQIKLDGPVIAGFFEPSIECIVDAVVSQQGCATRPVSTVFLVGGFAASDYLFYQLRQRLGPRGLEVCRPDSHVSKAVPDGAIVGYLRPSVRTRVAKHTYGVRCTTMYDPFDPEHLNRTSQSFASASEMLVLPGFFSKTLLKDTQVSDTQEFRSSFYEESMCRDGLVTENLTTITCYRGDIQDIQFVDQDPDNFHDVFTIRADLTQIADNLQERKGESGAQYLRLDYEIIILFGLTEFKAQYAWKENGNEKRSPAEVLFDANVVYQV